MFVHVCMNMYINFLLFSSELNDQTKVCITTTVATKSNTAAIAGGVSAGLIFILVITVLLVFVLICIPRFRRSKIIDSVSICVCVCVCIYVLGGMPKLVNE